MEKTTVPIAIPKEQLKEYSDYTGFPFNNNYRNFCILNTVEQIQEVNKWETYLPINLVVVESMDSNEPIIGNKYMIFDTPNKELKEKSFKYLGPNKDGIDAIDMEDENGKKIITTIHFFYNAYTYLGLANDKEKAAWVSHKNK